MTTPEGVGAAGETGMPIRTDPPTPTMVEEISPEELHERIQSDDSPQIIDIRPPAAFAQGHVPGAENVPMTELAARIGEVDWADDIVVTCPIGQSSIQAARLIGSFEGADDAEVRSLAGGYDAWAYDIEQGQ